MNYLRGILCLSILFSGSEIIAQDSTGLTGIPYQETADGGNSYLFKEWYSGSVRMQDDKVYDGVQLRYDIKKDEIEFKKDSALYRISNGVQEFTIPSGTDLYIFRSGFPAGQGQTAKSFYRVMYDGNTKLLKKYISPIRVEKASATKEMDPDAKLYVVKDNKLSAVKLSDKNSFLKLLPDEKNKMLYIIKEQQLDFGAEDDLVSLLSEYDSYKAGRGGN
ncbi:hypothetical protein [Dyadobacter psychrotolerans]|uniref:Uncharacterized protein n=1 Tax=Dyadobacter psychrotolerans TaxID=2541721 RepID=A0A4V2Z3C1_9BACT|nr:hypothetical protein [Dyadobacter psychrotolerans]TDE11568.1 hypothetical protein E0F88_24340 [Dyadobacter psychrotolerans]